MQDFFGLGDEFRLENGKEAYGQGIWAPCIRYHNGKFYIFSNINGHGMQVFIADKASNSFSGSSAVVLPFTVSIPTRVIIDIIPNVAVYGDMMLSNMSIKLTQDTAIDAILPTPSADTHYYDLGGKKTTATHKGVYIHQGKKYTR